MRTKPLEIYGINTEIGALRPFENEPYYSHQGGTQQNLNGLPVKYSINGVHAPFSRHEVRYYSQFVRQDLKPEFVNYSYLDWVFHNQKLVFRDTGTGDILVVTAKKRGNTAYSHYVHEKLSFLPNGTFSQYLKEHNYNGVRVGAVFITLTYPLEDKGKGWLEIGKDWNRFLSKLKKKYGKIRFVRVWESTFNGAPHIHALIFFDKKPIGFKGRDGVIRLNREDFDYIRFSWDYNTYLEPVRDCEKAFYYVLKYVFKSIDGHGDKVYYQRLLDDYLDGKELNGQGKKDIKGFITNSQVWFYGKRSYGISRDLLNKLNGDSILIRERNNSNSQFEFLGLIDDYLYRIPDGVYNSDSEIIHKMVIFEGWTDT